MIHTLILVSRHNLKLSKMSELQNENDEFFVDQIIVCISYNHGWRVEICIQLDSCNTF